ncbi:MAG: C1 family peptidase [Saprospiraceae bacterium]
MKRIISKVILSIKRIKYIFTSFTILLTSLQVLSQGLLFNDQLHEHQNKMPVYDEGSKAELETLKGIYKVDLRLYCPEPQDQGFISSCAGWACGYGALSILQAIEKKWGGNKDSITRNAFSALFIYNQIKKGSCDFGAYISDAATLIRDKGDVRSKDFDKLKNKCDRVPTEKEIEFAHHFRIKDFMTVFGSADAPSVKVQRTKLSLVQKKPVVIGILLLKNFENIPPGDEYWYAGIGDTTTNGGHSMVVVGFDDGREAFEVMNSWGTSWANSGFVWIKYRDFGKYCRYGYMFIPEGEKIRFYDLAVSIILNKPAFSEMNELTFHEEPVRWINGYYELTKGSSLKGDLLQPTLLETRKDAYFYVFSVDAKNNIKVHWPRDGLLDSKFEGNHESAIITIPKIELSIPGKYSALSLDSPGIEYWCFLISGKPITHLNEYLNSLKSSTIQDFNKKLKRVFGSQLLSSDRITYSIDKIQAESDMSGGEIVPLVLRFKIGS